MWVSFTPAGDWFIFNTTTGKTVRRGFPTKAAAWTYVRDNRL